MIMPVSTLNHLERKREGGTNNDREHLVRRACAFSNATVSALPTGNAKQQDWKLAVSTLPPFPADAGPWVS